MSVHREQEVLTSKDIEEAEKAVILLHGRGATAASMLRLKENLPEAAYYAPQAANRTWYPESFMNPVENNQPHLDSALEKVDRIIEEVTEHVPQEKVFLLGFSQGACLASEYAATNPGRYGGVIVFSGGVIGQVLEEYTGDMEETPVFLGCSEKDPHIPLKRVEETEETFEDLDADVEKYIFEGSHHGIVDYEFETAREIIES